MKKHFLILLVCLLMVALAGCGSAQESLDSLGVAMEIPAGLENSTGKVGYQGYDFVYVGNDMAIFGSKGDLNAEGVDENMTLMTCAENAMKSVEAEAEILTAEKGYLYFVHEADTGLNEFVNVSAFYENGDEFWMIQVSSKQKSYDEAAVFAMLDSVKFN